MPRVLPTSRLLPAIEHLERVSRSDVPIVVVLGASPAWGDAVQSGSATIPAALQRCAGSGIAVFNFASNGQLLGDSYFLARRVSDDADLLVVQLTYHGYNSQWRQGATQRYPELPRLLGVPVEVRTADVLGVEPTPRVDISGMAERWLSHASNLYEIGRAHV